MKRIKFNEKEYQIPENWLEVTLGMVIRTSEYQELIPELPLIAIIAGYTGIPIEELKVSKVAEVNEIMEILEFIYVEYKSSPRNKFMFEGQEFIASPDILEIEFQDWVSLQTILYNYKESPVRALPGLIAVLCKREGEKLDDINIEERQEMFKRLPYVCAKDVEGFFLASKRVSEVITQLSLMESRMPGLLLDKVRELRSIIKGHKERNGGSWLMRLVIGIYTLYLKRLERGLERYYNSRRIGVSSRS